MIDTSVLAAYTIVSDADTVRMWVFLEKSLNTFSREFIRYQLTQHLAQHLPDEIIHFEFHLTRNAAPPIDVEPGGFWAFFQPGQTFSGSLTLFPAADDYIELWQERFGMG